MTHERMQRGNWWVLRRKPGVGWQYWDRTDECWAPWPARLAEFAWPGTAPGDQILSYASTWAEPELELEETA